MSDPDEREKGGAAPRRIAPDEERTHLILDPPCLEDESEGDKDKAPLPEEPPTRLVIDAIKPGMGGDARTQLMLGPLILKEELIRKEEPMALLPFLTDKPGWLFGHARRLGFWLDERLHALWGVGLVLAALVCGILPPLIGGADGLGSVATVIVSLALWLGLAAFGVTWLGNLQPQGRHGFARAIVARLRGAIQLVTVDIRELQHSPVDLKVWLSGRWLAGAGLLGLSAVSAGSLLLWLSELSEPPSTFRWLSGLMLLLGLALARGAVRYRIVAPRAEELEESVAAANALAAIVDLSESLPPSFIDGYTPLHRILIALTQWRGASYASPRSPGSGWPDEAGYRAALERHLQRHLPACRIEGVKWLGSTRADGIAGIVIDDMVVVEVARGFDPPSAARAIARLSELGRTWRDKPMILAVFEALRDPVFQSAATASLIELHERFPLLTVRMPFEQGSGEPASRSPGEG